MSGADVLYERGSNSMASGNYRNAIRYFEALEARFPFAATAKQSQLDLIYAYYRNGSEEQCIDAAIQFERENPTHPRVDYALYMRGLALFVPQHGRLQRWFRMDLSKRPPVDAREAFSVLSQLIQRYPDSQYSADAQVRLTFLRNRLAAHELHIANYYMRRGADVAALNRAKFAMENFDGSPSTPEALKVMIRAYRNLGMLDLATDTERVLAQSYPGESIEPARKKKRFIFF
jgi:outer membrane protein assembly factor BamD